MNRIRKVKKDRLKVPKGFDFMEIPEKIPEFRQFFEKILDFEKEAEYNVDFVFRFTPFSRQHLKNPPAKKIERFDKARTSILKIGEISDRSKRLKMYTVFLSVEAAIFEKRDFKKIPPFCFRTATLLILHTISASRLTSKTNNTNSFIPPSFHIFLRFFGAKIGGHREIRVVRGGDAAVPRRAIREEESCFHRLPFGSLIGALLCILGVILFAIMLSWAFNATAEQVRRTLRNDNWPWLDKVQIFFIVIAALMGMFSLFFLIIGFTATGATRTTVYNNNDSQCGGKFACVLAMFFDLILLVAWLFIIAIVSMLSIFYFFFDRLCWLLPAYTEADCIDLHVFWPLVASFSNSNLRLCGGDVQQFCALSSTAFTWYVIGWVGCVLVIIGLLLFFGIHASNYAHIGNAHRYIELDQLRIIDYPPPPAPSQNSRSHRTQDFYASEKRSNTSSRFAEAMSDSVSQFDYRRDKRPKPVY
ncbi:unnamed protein product [Caenorhabditis angaria]|uniref:Uncharacterized protein n=1 Tax=Caenorhabditis angaria TaxID=860376 RepID=A0A9P1IA34_9PELO|nr:unnamed protein product [Caenorhabditis angaria]